MKPITIRQLSCFCGFALLSFKFLGLPSLMYVFNDDGGLFTALFLLIIDIFMIVLLGGMICAFAEMVNFLFGISCGISALFFCLLCYPVLLMPSGKIVKWGGAGALVPITGFANSVASTAIEFKKEGQVFGVGSKIFTIAGPVILYGIFSSWILGVIYWITHFF